MPQHDIDIKRDPVEKELDIPLALTEQMTELKQRVTHLETLEPAGAATMLILNIDITEINVTNTAAETTVYSESIAGGVLSTNNAIHLFLEGLIVNTSGVGVSPTIRVKYGATTILSIAASLPNGTNEEFEIDARIFADGATGAQKGQLIARRASGNLDSDRGTAAEDSTVAQTLEVTVQWPGASAAVNFQQREAVLKQYISP